MFFWRCYLTSRQVWNSDPGLRACRSTVWLICSSSQWDLTGHTQGEGTHVSRYRLPSGGIEQTLQKWAHQGQEPPELLLRGAVGWSPRALWLWGRPHFSQLRRYILFGGRQRGGPIPLARAWLRHQCVTRFWWLKREGKWSGQASKKGFLCLKRRMLPRGPGGFYPPRGKSL